MNFQKIRHQICKLKPLGCGFLLSTLAILLPAPLSPLAQAQTQHGAAPDDQRLILPAERPVDAPDSGDGDDPGVLFPPSPESTRFLRITTGPVRGGYYAVGGVICDLLNRDMARHRIECLVRPSSGSGENIAHILSGGAEMGLVQSDWQNFAVTTAGDAADIALDFGRLRSVAALYPLATQIVVRNALGLTDIRQLDGRRLGLTRAGSGQRQLSEVVLAQAGIRLSSLQLSEFDTDAAMVRALCAGQIDALILVGPAPMQAVDVALNRCDSNLLGLAPDLIETLIGGREALASFALGPETYASLTGPIDTLGYMITLMTSAGLEDRLAAEVARALNTQVSDFAAAYPALASVDGTQFFSAGLTAAIHDGVARYLDTVAQDFDDDSGGDGEINISVEIPNADGT